jgi:2-keto-4-pentenoate hydratase
MTMVIEEWVQKLFSAREAGQSKPGCSGEFDSVDEAMAYRVQAGFVEKMIQRSPISGFKGALTNRAAQASMGMNTPASGVLLKEMEWLNESVVDRSQFIFPVMETEIGLVIAKDITSCITISDLPDYIAHYQPMVEMADIGAKDPSSLSVYDFIAGNSAAAGYIAGEKSDVRDVNNVVVSLYKDGEKLHDGKGSDAMGDQGEATVWLINQLVSQGYVVAKGHVLMTGSLGRVNMKTEPGQYTADFGDFGKVEFELE